jgi:pimeloyl-ACP methyl ester carboxylesterase
VFRAALNSLRGLTFHTGPRREAEWLAWAQAEKQRKPEDIEAIEPVRRRLMVDGRELGWIEAGDRSRQTIVVLAGTPYRDATHLAPHVWHLAKDYHVVVLQRGASALTAATLSQAHRAAELTQLQAALQKPRIALLADAGAGHFALRYASDHAREVAAVVLHGGPWPSPAAMRRMPAQIAAALPLPWRDDVAWVRSLQGLLHPDLVLRVLGRSHHAAVLATPEAARRLRQVELFYDGLGVEAAERLAGESQGWDAAKIAVPVLVLHGKQAPWAGTSQEDVNTLAADVRKWVQVAPLDGCGAMPLVERPSEAVRAISAFLP